MDSLDERCDLLPEVEVPAVIVKSLKAAHAMNALLLEVRRRIFRRMVGSPRRNYGRSTTGNSWKVLPKAARTPKVLRHPRAINTKPSTPAVILSSDKYYRRRKGAILSKLQQLRKMAWYREYQKKLARIAMAKGTRKRHRSISEAQTRRGHDDLRLVQVKEYNPRRKETYRFQTGIPVEFQYYRNAQKSPHMGSMFDQDIEPSGRFMMVDTLPNDPSPGWEVGSQSFRNPLVIEYVNTTGEAGWKQRLSRYYGGKTGRTLSRALVRDGYDAIVTVDSSIGETREVVSLVRR